MPDRFICNTSQPPVKSLCELVTDPFAVAMDAFQIPRKDQQGCAFPPFALVGKCLQKILQEESMVVLVAPVWETQPWHPFLLQLLIDYPLLPAHSVLRDPFERKHPLLLRHQLQLATWKVSGISTWQQAFQRGLPDSFSQDGARAHRLPVWLEEMA